MGLERSVRCAGGFCVVQRGGEPVQDERSLFVAPVGVVALPGGIPVEARRIDEVVWRRHWLEPDRLVIEFVDLATVEVQESSGFVVFDRELPAEMEQHLLFDHVLPLVLARRGHLVLHGGLISRSGRGVVLVGASGAGKSTLTAFAWRCGWTVGGDDGAVLSTTTPPTAEPTYSTVRLTPASVELLGLDPATGSAVAGKARFGGEGVDGFRQDSTELNLVVIIEPAPSDVPARLERLEGIEAHASLFGSTFHAELAGRSLLPAVIDRLAQIVETTSVGRLLVPRGTSGLESAEAVLRRHVEPGETPFAPTPQRVEGGPLT